MTNYIVLDTMVLCQWAFLLLETVYCECLMLFDITFLQLSYRIRRIILSGFVTRVAFVS